MNEKPFDLTESRWRLQITNIRIKNNQTELKMREGVIRYQIEKIEENRDQLIKEMNSTFDPANAETCELCHQTLPEWEDEDAFSAAKAVRIKNLELKDAELVERAEIVRGKYDSLKQSIERDVAAAARLKLAILALSGGQPHEMETE